MEDLKNKFLNISGDDKYQRVGMPHPIAWYIGFDGTGRYSLFVITKAQPKALSSTNLINVFIGKRKDEDYGITFSLQENRMLDLFVHFCEDMIDASRNVTQISRVADFVCARYEIWQKAFIKTGGTFLSYEQIKGLLGEMCFLKMKMIPEYGQEKALDSWSGIEQTSQDFICDGAWYEIKSTVSGAISAKISSVEQLDSDREGHLVILRLDKTSDADLSRITLNSMYNLLIETFSSQALKERFIIRLIQYGYYPDKEYDKLAFRYNGMSLYKVGADFPCIRKKDIPIAVGHVKYELSLAAIDSFKEN